jgi:cell division protein FtsZ
MKAQKQTAPNPAPSREKTSMKVFGVGGAGGNAVQQMAKKGLEGATFFALNTDIHALADCLAPQTLPLGAKLTRGLGAGGDPEIGRAAAEQDADPLRDLCAGADIVVVVTGLGGGTGTGASPVLARLAKEAGALTLAVVTLPFECEGTRRQCQARAGLEQLKEAADAVLCLPNDRVLKLIDENTSLIETFKITNDLLAQGVRGIWRLLTRTGIINVDFADLCAVVSGRHAESSFATADARGEHRARDVAEKILTSPLLDGGAVLSEAESVLVSVVGGAELTMAEVNRVMARINRACENAHIILGAAVDEEFKDRLSVTVVATRRAGVEPENRREMAPAASADAPETSRLAEPAAGEGSGFDSQFLSSARSPRPASRFIAPPPALTAEQKEQALAQQNAGRSYRKPRSKMRQGMLPLEIVSKGRFEKSEPTIYQGEDLDVPTYIRRGVPLN